MEKSGLFPETTGSQMAGSYPEQCLDSAMWLAAYTIMYMKANGQPVSAPSGIYHSNHGWGAGGASLRRFSHVGIDCMCMQAHSCRWVQVSCQFLFGNGPGMKCILGAYSFCESERSASEMVKRAEILIEFMQVTASALNHSITFPFLFDFFFVL